MYRNLNRKLTELEEKVKLEQHQHLRINPDNSIIFFSTEKNKIYVPNSTFKIFHQSQKFVRGVMGPYNSGKSTGCAIAEVLIKTCNHMPAWSNGRRKAKWIFIRNTSCELYSTTLPTWLLWCGELGDIVHRQKPILTYEHTFNDGKGIVELEILFLALDREQHIRKLKSLEATGAYVNEISEIPQAVLSHLKGRVNGRYPSVSFCPKPYWCGIICDTNPPDEEHWFKKEFEDEKNSSYELFKQPPGLQCDNKLNPIKDSEGHYIQNINCDNYENIKPDYYPKLAEKQNESFIKVFCLGRYGVVPYGKPVYNEYNDDLHSCDNLEPIPDLPIHLGWDFGLTPACMVVQITPRGQLRLLKEYFTDNMGIRTFAISQVLMSLPIDFPHNKIGLSRADPSGNARDVIDEDLSCIGELTNLGIPTEAASTNEQSIRKAAMVYFLTNMSDGQPCFMLSRKGCPNARKDMIKDYHYPPITIAGEKIYKETPVKNMASHRQEACQYIAMAFAPSEILRNKAPAEKVNMYNPVMQFGG